MPLSAEVVDMGSGILKAKVVGTEGSGNGAVFDDLHYFRTKGLTLTEYKLTAVNISNIAGHMFSSMIGHIQSKHMRLDRVLLPKSSGNPENSISLRFWKGLSLNPTEYITSVSGTFQSAWDINGSHTLIKTLTFCTSQNRCFELGSSEGNVLRASTAFGFSAPENHCIVGFWGSVRSNRNLNTLGVYLTKMCPFKWSESTHCFFPPSFRDKVLAFLLVCQRHGDPNWSVSEGRMPLLYLIPDTARSLIFTKLAELTFSHGKTPLSNYPQNLNIFDDIQ